jgi:type IV pilus assembly protein PilW
MTLAAPNRVSGMTLIELMVALAIGMFLMIGAMTVFMQSRTTFRVTESISRLQETARFAIDTLEPDIRMAGYWGLTSRAYLINGRRTLAQPNGIGPATCGNNWTINLIQPVQGTNNVYNWACAGTAPVEANADTLVVRHAGDNTVAIPQPAGQLSIVSTRGGQPGQIFNTAAAPAGFNLAPPPAGTAEVHRLVVNGYYVRRASAANPQPELHRKTLQSNGNIVDELVVAGIEDMQIEFGVDTDVPGTPTAPNPNRGSIDRYVNPDDPMIDPTNAGFNPNAEILAVRIWLRARAERSENGFTDATNYVYADQNVGPFNDGFRRIVVSKTIYLRNARPPS